MLPLFVTLMKASSLLVASELLLLGAVLPPVVFPL
jgi:hypothetical protein